MTNKIWAVGVESSCPPGKECQAGHGYFGGWRGRLIIRSGAAVAPRATHICGGQFCCCLPTGSSPMAAGMVATRPYVWVSNFRAKNFKLRTKLKVCNDHSSNNLALTDVIPIYDIYAQGMQAAGNLPIPKFSHGATSSKRGEIWTNSVAIPYFSIWMHRLFLVIFTLNMVQIIS